MESRRSERHERKSKKRQQQRGGKLYWVIVICIWALALFAGWQAGKYFFG